MLYGLGLFYWMPLCRWLYGPGHGDSPFASGKSFALRALLRNVCAACAAFYSPLRDRFAVLNTAHAIRHAVSIGLLLNGVGLFIGCRYDAGSMGQVIVTYLMAKSKASPNGRCLRSFERKSNYSEPFDSEILKLEFVRPRW